MPANIAECRLREKLNPASSLFFWNIKADSKGDAYICFPDKGIWKRN